MNWSGDYTERCNGAGFYTPVVILKKTKSESNCY